MKINRQPTHGFHLLELMITVAIIGILASICLPIYSQHLVKERRLEAAQTLSQLALALEKYQIENGSYQQATLSGLHFSEAIVQGHYRLIIEKATGSDYLLAAEPIGKQASEDNVCGTLTLNGEGEKGISGAGNLDDCW